MPASDAGLYGELYSYFTAALYRPEEDLFSPAFYSDIKAVSSSLGLDFTAELELVEESLRSEGMSLQQLKIEHSRLFVGPFALGAPPYESYYREKGLVMGESTVDVLRFYREAGFCISEDFKDAPDHIVLQVNFLAEMCAAEHALLQENNSEQAEVVRDKTAHFLVKHLLQWLGPFYAAVQKNADYPYYPAIVRMVYNTAAAHHSALKRGVQK